MGTETSFKTVKKLLQNNFNKITKNETHLFEVDLDKEEFWNVYLDSFPNGTNEIFRKRREYDCSCCRSFIKHIGNVVVIKDNKITTIWDLKIGDEVFQPVFDAMDKFVKSKVVSNVYISKFTTIGTDKNFEKLESVIQFDHFFLELPSKFVDRSSSSKNEIQGGFRDTRNVFKRSLDELTIESVSIVLELIAQNSLYKGDEWKTVLTEFLNKKRVYDALPDDEKSNYAWEQSVKVGGVIGRIRNHSIGTLLIDISEGEDLDLAVKKYEKVVAPINYCRSQPIYSKKMLDRAEEKLIEMGFLDSLKRRYATLEDINVNNILFADRDSVKKIKGNIFDEMSNDISINIKNFTKVEEIKIEDFIKNILPEAKKIEVFLESNHTKNMVSLIAPENKDSKTMFKWDNSFSWAYTGNITDSMLKENVKNAGGKVDGVLRFSIQWNDQGDLDTNDLDAHCLEPSGFQIYYMQKNNPITTGSLDIDITSPIKNVYAVENITWSDIKKMKIGTYKFYVHNYCYRGGRSGFRAEIEFQGQIYSFDYNKEVKQGQNVQVAEVDFDGTNFTIKEKLPSSNLSSREVWGLKSNQFHNVQVVCYSPNYWDEQNEIGHKHYMFLLKNCINPEMPNGFFNEFLIHDLNEYRKVIEALGAKLKIENNENQLSGLGFSSTKRNELIVKIESNIKRVLKIKF